MSALGLNEHHQQQALNFIRFNRYKRSQRLKGLDHCFQDLKDSRLYEDTYTVDEVTEMLDGLLTVCRSEMESELLNSSHTSVLLMRQMLTQAEKWHLKIEADISELENRELLEQIAEFEERELTLGGSSSAPKPKLAPLNETGGTALLQMEIERLNGELERFQQRSKKMEEQVNAVLREKNALQEQVKQLGEKPVATMDSATVSQLESDMKKLRSEFNENLNEKISENRVLEINLTTSKHQLLRVKEQLELAEKELDKKFRETAAYRNMKDMLTKKNNQIKDLRKTVAKYEPSD
ncbi:leucine zipper transcription factor-like protein 1 [Styela clava]